MINALQYFHPNGEAHELAKFIGMVNDVFDMANVRSVQQHVQKRNPNLQPYQDPEDPRLTWMRDVFLAYLEQWKTNVTSRPGFSKEEKQNYVSLLSNT